MGRLKNIELENFKSYAGYQSIGPFKPFQAVIGPNGAGKSNLMDAISFVLGVKSRHLRSHKLGDLVFRVDGKAVPSKRRASVKLVYEVDADEVEGLNAGDEIHYMRTIAASGVGSYRINDEEVTWENYDKSLRQIGVLTKARNFLVFQGDVESVASKSPKELTALIEQISGSEDFRAQYDELRKQKDEAEENTIFRLQQKKGYAAEKKQVREQKEEAERFNEKLEILSNTQREYFLFQLFHIRKEVKGHQETIEDLEETQGEIQAREATAEQGLKAGKKGLVKVNQELAAAEKAVKQHKSELDKLEPKHVKQEAELKNLKKKISDDEKAVKKIERDEKDFLERIEGIEEDIKVITEAEDELDKETHDANKKAGLKLNAEKEKEYADLKAESEKHTAADRSELESQTRQQTSDENTMASLENDLVELKNKMQQDKERLDNLKERASSISAAAQEAHDQAKAAEKELVELEGKEVKDSQKRTKLEAELEKVALQLRDAKEDRVQSKQEEKMAECLETLKRLHPGKVRGRLMDLCKPTQRKYDTAVTVAGGKHMDAIVVDNQQTGYECIRYMRENRIGVASFIPLTGLKVKDVNERLRSLGTKSRLCIDVIECDPEIKPAVMYAVENTVVFESLKDARDACFRRNEHIKAVTLDGSVISKAGTMTGGNAPSDAGKGNSRWDGQNHADLKAKRNELQAEMNKLDAVRHDTSHISELKTKIAQLKNKEQYATNDVKVTKEKIAGQQKQSQELKKQINIITQEKQKLKPIISNREAAMKELKDSIEKNEDKVFSKFCRSIGVSSIREFEDGQLLVLKQTSEKRRMMRENKAKLEAQLSYEKSKDFASPLSKIVARISQNKAKLSQGQKGKASLAKEEEQIRVNLRKAEEIRDEAKNIVEEKDIEVKALQSERAECSKEKLAISKKIIAEETNVEQLRGKLHTVLQKASFEEVHLPMIDGGVFQHSGSISENTSQQSDATSSGSTHFSQKDNAQVKQDYAKAEKIDYSELKKHRDARPNQVESIKKTFETKISDLKGEIEIMQPNMKAGEKFEDISTRHKTSAEDFDLARESARDATAMFNEIKQKRHDMFMQCFNHISNELQAIYKDLTKSSKHPLGGNAYLSLDDTEEPYLGGIKYNAMPPMKRFRDMDQLSGGEKTVAALAFLFSIHSFRPAPFFVMDEVDAALDNVNVKKICNYIKQRSKDFQVVAISLKDIFYEQADALVGICRDVKTNSSRTLTMDLEQFD
jgi:structural maintenance of chromosome 1